MHGVLSAVPSISLIALHGGDDVGRYLLSRGAKRPLIRFSFAVWLVSLLWHNLLLRVAIITLVVITNNLLYLDLACATRPR